MASIDKGNFKKFKALNLFNDFTLNLLRVANTNQGVEPL